MIYVVNVSRGVFYGIVAEDVTEARNLVYAVLPDWRGDWITTCTETPPTKEEMEQLMAWTPEQDWDGGPVPN